MRKSGSIFAALLAGIASQPALANAATQPWGVSAPGDVEMPGIKERIRGALQGGIILMATAFTNAGTQIIVDRVMQTGTAPKNIGWGTGTTTAAVTQTALVTEAAPTTSGGRTVGTESKVTTTNTGDTYQVAGTVTAGSSLAITEAGTFDNVTAGNMLIRGDFSAVNVVSGDSIAFTVKLKMVSSAA